VTMEIRQVLTMIIEFNTKCPKILDTFKLVDRQGQKVLQKDLAMSSVNEL